MLHTIIDNLIIILLTLLCVFRCSNPALFIIVAGALMVVTTMTSLDEDRGKFAIIIKLVVVALYAFASQSLVGFVAFFLLDEIKNQIRLIMAVVTYMVANLLIIKEHDTAHIIVGAIILAASLAIVLGIKLMLTKYEERKIADKNILMKSNISEMHEKRANRELLKQSYLAQKNARLMERENISRNIHNSVGHSITAAVMTLDAADMLYDVKPEDARKKMNEANERIRGSLESIRQAVRVLDSETDGITASDLKAAMKDIVKEFVMDTSIEVDELYQELPEEVNVSHEHSEFLTGVLMELLTNGVKHGSATYFKVVLKGDAGHIRLSVEDNGSSDYNAENSQLKLQQGFGLKKIVSYVQRCGGEATFANEDGFKAVIELPMEILNSEG